MHPVNKPKEIYLNSRVCVPVIRKDKKLIRDGTIAFSRNDTPWTELPKDFQILDENGNIIPASGKFLITVESIDPYHLITDYKGD